MRFLITEAENGMLLRAFVKKQGVSAALLARLKRNEQGMLVNGKRVTVRAVLQTGDVVDLAIENEEEWHVIPCDLPLEVLLETPDLLVLNKPANMPTHPSHGHMEDTLANALAHHYAKDGVPFRPRFINRLDRDTTGAVLVARHALSASALACSMAKRRIEKTYLALVHGRMTEPLFITSGIRRMTPISIITREICEIDEGEYARTYALPLATNGEMTLVKLVPETGRTHQLRVHLSALGHPLLGDGFYGDGTGLSRHALHAATLTFPSPNGEGSITVRAPLPPDMKEKITLLGKEALALAERECAPTGREIQ